VLTTTSPAAELTVSDRSILASSAYATSLDRFSREDRLPVVTSPRNLVRRQRQYYSRGKAYLIEWQDYGQPLPAWFDPLMQGFVDLLTLEQNWDSYGGNPISPGIIDEAITLANEVLGPASPAPHVAPLSSGGLQLEWHRQGIDLEIVFDRAEQPFFYFRNRATGEESEHPLPEERVLLQSIIQTLG